MKRREFLLSSSSLAVLSGFSLAYPLRSQAASYTPSSSPIVNPGQNVFTYSSPGNPERLIREYLPIGHGRMGALIQGGTGSDDIVLSEASIWTGNRNDNSVPDGFSFERENMGSFTRLGGMKVHINNHESVTNYKRQIDFENSICKVSYDFNGANFSREYIASHPDNIIAIHYKVPAGEQLSGEIELSGTHGETTEAKIYNSGSVNRFLVYTGTFSNGLTYGAALTIVGGGSVSVASSGKRLQFTASEDFTVLVDSGSNYTGEESTNYINPNLNIESMLMAHIASVSTTNYQTLLWRHVYDYRQQFSTFSAYLGQSSSSQRNTDIVERTANVFDGEFDPELETAYVQFMRYLSISGSRQDSLLPMNLQGIWCETNTPPWHGDYHTNINIQMNYWGQHRTGIASHGWPLLKWMKSQVNSWTNLTRDHFNHESNSYRNRSGSVAGWTIATSANISGGMGWRWDPPGNAWLCNNLWQFYLFSQDNDFLTESFPLMEGAVEFWLHRFVKRTINDPSTKMRRDVFLCDMDWSPEHGSMTEGASYAQECVWDLFSSYEQACKILFDQTGDLEFSRKLADIAVVRSQLYLPQTNSTNEHFEEWVDSTNTGGQHRHLSHLIGVFPGYRILNENAHPEILSGVKNSLDTRGYNSFGWANVWRGLCWSRLKNPTISYQMWRTNISRGLFENFLGNYNGGSNNLVFQIDANLGSIAAFTEMLAFSKHGTIELFPALPPAWTQGLVKGLGCVGGYTLDLEWGNGLLISAVIRGNPNSSVSVVCGSNSRYITLDGNGYASISEPWQVGSARTRESDFPVSGHYFEFRAAHDETRFMAADAVKGAEVVTSSTPVKWKLIQHSRDTFYIAHPDDSSLCINVHGGSYSTGAEIRLWDISDVAENALWRLTSEHDGRLVITNVRSQLSISVPSSDGLVATQHDAISENERWILQSNAYMHSEATPILENQSYRLRNVESGALIKANIDTHNPEFTYSHTDQSSTFFFKRVPDTQNDYHVFASNNDDVLGTTGNQSYSNNGAVITWTVSNTGENGQWVPADNHDGTWTFFNRRSGLPLADNEGLLSQLNESELLSTKWSIEAITEKPEQGITYNVTNGKTAGPLSSDSSYSAGSNIFASDHISGAISTIHFVQVSGTEYFEIVFGNTGQALNITGAESNSTGGSAVLWHEAGDAASDNQLWKIVENGDGTVRFESKRSGYVLTARNSTDSNGTPQCEQNIWAGVAEQKWFITQA
ncbi:glycoside hydrolase N-terminal domain-containing protein [Parasalinivibrio latis]|uniref:glycosyl hydrolase family 95 catalytic domain-containing protein n=1 Tax=Parasalinivibrio latis TaxID=2952610 RepID=UPI0030E3534B